VLFKHASKCCDYARLILVKNRSSREDDLRIPNSPGMSFYRVFAVTSSFATRSLVDSTRVFVCYRFYFLRFLLICHWESLNLTYTLKWFFFLENISKHHLRTVPETGCSLAKQKQTFFNDFLLDFWASVSEVFKQDFLLITWSKETIFGFEKLGEDGKSIFRKLYSPSNKPPIFRKWLIFVERILSCISEFLWLRLSWVFSAD